jgi:hypothetical protein
VDNCVSPGPEPANHHRWAPPVALVVVGWVAAVAALAWCVLGSADPAGRLLGGVAALVLTVAALFGTLARPRLAADHSGLRVRGFGGTASYGWPQISRLRLVHTRRFGRNVPTLEIEVWAGGPEAAQDERLLVFGWLELGADPRDVADDLRAVRPV